MNWRASWMVTLLVVTLAGLFGKPAGTSAEFMAQGPYPPDGLRIPGTIELLSDTAYYPAADTPADQPEGWFSPQNVNVIETNGAWSIGAGTWKIETMFGPRWIRPNPWEIDIAPPDHILLTSDTPLYSKMSERGGSVAALAPQEVKVVRAEKQWFYTNDPSSKTWIQIHTSWMGDLWAHIPVKQIGTVQDVSKHVYYQGIYGSKELLPLLQSAQTSMESASAGETRILQEYTTIYDRYFLVETEVGPLWTLQAGVTIVPSDETLNLTTEIPLFTGPSNKETAVLSGEKVTAFEKITQPLWTGRGPYEIWHFSTWYHVHTSKGTGWINLLYGEPADAVNVHWKVSIRGDRELMRYPDVHYTSSVLLLRNQDVEVSAVWSLPNGTTLLKASKEGHTGWIPLQSWNQDRFWDLDTGTELQIETQYPQQVIFKLDSQGALKWNEDVDAGFVKEGVDVLKLKVLAEQLGYEQADVEGAKEAVRFTKGDYGFVLHKGGQNAEIYWKGILTNKITLSSAPTRSSGDGELYLEQPAVKQLFGLSPIPWYEGHAYYEGSYKVELGKLPEKLTGTTVKLNAFLYDTQVQWTQKNLKDAIQPRLSLEENNDLGGKDALSSIAVAPASKTVTADTVTPLYHLSTSRTLTSGPHDLKIILRVGERIVWMQPWHVVME
ncbi:hypothetical protein [Paenibacillus qinlingensis]|uniref:hypothetical protein n=1 Tax=Paenibacillus qinlingensis TaxID=1837343 RepID=UPI001566F31C|nr:hypothetical protein [Paenibacillus qinlingensis]NQX61450.1 hypothetical protein [Paenibacillus qinlingensis]